MKELVQIIKRNRLTIVITILLSLSAIGTSIYGFVRVASANIVKVSIPEVKQIEKISSDNGKTLDVTPTPKKTVIQNISNRNVSSSPSTESTVSERSNVPEVQTSDANTSEISEDRDIENVHDEDKETEKKDFEDKH